MKPYIFLLFFMFGQSFGNYAEPPSTKYAEIKYDEIIFVENVNSLNELLEQFNGEVVYIEVWASFCKPSLEAFKYREELKVFFQANRIVSLFISMDGARQREKWKSVVRENTLNGYHISMSDNGNISKDILNLLSSEEGRMDLSIPRYIIIGRNGKIVGRKAPSPQEKQKLITQLAEYLK